MFEQNRSSALRSAAVLALCALFFLLAMGIALFGSRIYRGAVRTADANDARRTALSYLVNQIRRNDTAGACAWAPLTGWTPSSSPTAVM